MASTSETGNEINVVNLKTLYEYLESLPNYKPSREAISIANLKKVHTDLTPSVSTLRDIRVDYADAVDEQQALFKPFKKHITRVMKAVRTSVEDQEQADTAESICKKIAGTRITAKKKDPEATQISTAQLSYDSQTKNFRELIAEIKKIPGYKPNETELTISVLEKMATDMEDKVAAVNKLEGIIVNAKKTRDLLLYSPKTGLLDLVELVKQYMGSAFGDPSPELKYVRKLKFRRVNLK